MSDQDMYDYEGPPDGLGHRTARERIAHLLCGLRRDPAPDDAAANSIELPLSMAPIANALGLTPVHVRVTLRHLAAEGLIATTGRTVAILDVERLKTLAELDPQ